MNDDMTVIAYVGLGSNLSSPASQLDRALEALAALPDSELQQTSSFYTSQPVGPQDQPDFVNAVARLRTSLSPLLLLAQLQAIEKAQGRLRTRHWGPRTLDLDLLLYGDQTIDLPQLQVPHPEMTQREFVLAPLQEIAPDLRIPGSGPLAHHLSRCPDNRLRRLDH